MSRSSLFPLGLFACVALLWPGGVLAREDRHVDAVLDVMPDMGDRFETVDELMKEKRWDRVLEKLAEIIEEAGETVWSSDGKVYTSVI